MNALGSFKVAVPVQTVYGFRVAEPRQGFQRRHDGPGGEGPIITTGSFTSEARKEAVRDGVPAIELVDGEKLVTMLEGLEAPSEATSHVRGGRWLFLDEFSR